jgi:hypothetical protein
MSRGVRLLIFFMILYSAFAQPGLPPCWLMAESCSVHPHPGGHPELPHDHGYLFDLGQANSDGIAPALPVPARLLIAAAYAASLLLLLADEYIFSSGWVTPPDSPPPRLSDLIAN